MKMKVIIPEEYYEKWFDRQLGEWKEETPKEVLELRDECMRNRKIIEEKYNIIID